MNLIMMGAPGAGKGTQAEVISEKFHIPVISTGNLIREEMKNATELGKEAKGYMDAGRLLPDDVVIRIVQSRLLQKDCEKGFILDGFPRTVPQAEALDKMGVTIDKVIDIDVSDDVIAGRVSGRRICADCGASYHIQYKPPKKAAVCDICGGKLIQREDDRPETVKTRLEVYHKQTEPLKDYYSRQKKLYVVKGQEEISQTTALTLKTLEA